MKNTKLIVKRIEEKSIVWFALKNKYSILEPRTADILVQLNENLSVEKVAEDLSKELDIPYEKSIDFVLTVNQELFIPNTTEGSADLENDYKDIQVPRDWGYIKFYRINNFTCKVCFKDTEELSLIHPKFAHLEVSDDGNATTTFEVFSSHNYIFLYVDGEFIGTWSRKERHYFQGKFAMEFIQKLHQLPESEWLSVFHASAVSRDKKCVLFLGVSGSGKSTSLALLRKNGFNCLADDFVPFAKENQHMYSFGCSISIKKSSLPVLLDLYPELEDAAEYHYPNLGKIVRYLPPGKKDLKAHLPCQDLVFIKYNEDVELEFSKIPNLKAFEELIPDSWLSPLPENASIFLDWFANVNCYQLTYSDNQKMIETVDKLFANDL